MNKNKVNENNGNGDGRYPRSFRYGSSNKIGGRPRRKVLGREALKLNPAFASAHGLDQKNNFNANEDSTNSNDLMAKSSLSLIERALSRARSTGKLSLPNMGLTAQTLPDSMFDLRSKCRNMVFSLDVSGGDGKSNYDSNHRFDGDRSWECYGEEMLTLLDMSDNDLGCIYGNSTLDRRIICYKALNTLRIKRCNLTNLPWEAINENLYALKVIDATHNNFTVVPFHLIPESCTELLLHHNQIKYLCDGNDEEITNRHNDGSSKESNQVKELILPHLTKVDLSENYISTLPSTLATPALQHLFLCKNSIKIIPKAIMDSCRSTLISIDISENQLSFPASPSTYNDSGASLTCKYDNSGRDGALILSKGNFNFDFTLHTKLQVLELRRNQLEYVPRISFLVTRLGLSHNCIESLDGLFYFTNEGENNEQQQQNQRYFRSKLKELHLEKNHLCRQLHPPTLATMTELTFLDISHNSLENLPFVLGYLPHLRRIVLDGNPLRMIRYAIKDSTSCTRVNLDTTAVLKQTLRKKGDAPPGPGYSTDGEGTLDTSSFKSNSACNGKDTPVDVRTKQKREEAKTIVNNAIVGTRTLKLNGRKLASDIQFVNSILTELSKVEYAGCESDGDESSRRTGKKVKTLNISNNELVSIKTELIESLLGITTLDASFNRLASFPDNLNRLALTHLLCARNCITSKVFQDSVLSNLSSPLVIHLVHLDLSSNQIKWIPSGLFDLPSLSNLNLSHNEITTLSYTHQDKIEYESSSNENLGWKHGLVSLEHLDLSNNQLLDLGFLPLALSGCKKLRSLLLNNNNIMKIPLELGLLEQLTKIDVRGNPQRSIRVDILERKSPDLLEYLKGRMDLSQITWAREQHCMIALSLSLESPIGVRPKDSVTLFEGKELNEYNDEHPKSGFDTRSSVARKDDGFSKEETSSHDVSMNGQLQEIQLRITSNMGIQNPQKEDSNLPKFLSLTLKQELELQIDKLTLELESSTLSQAKRYAIKKNLAIQKSKLIREKRKLKESC